jgi:hypothetical protein
MATVKRIKKTTLSVQDKNALRRIMKKVRQIRLYQLQQARK